MLDKQRIQEAESNVKIYLNEGKLKKEQPSQEAIRILIRNSQESIASAEKLRDTSDLWIIVCSYYSMFYIANAVLIKVGDKIAHQVTSDALIVFVKNKLKAVTSLQRAKIFFNEMQKLLLN